MRCCVLSLYCSLLSARLFTSSQRLLLLFGLLIPTDFNISWWGYVDKVRLLIVGLLDIRAFPYFR